MKKILGILEAYVQWGALALGAAFLGWMVWTYIFQNPASKPLNLTGVNEIVTPGDVDTKIRDSVAANLQTAVTRTGSNIEIAVPPLAPLDVAPPATQPIVAQAWDSWAQDIQAIVGANAGKGAVLVVALPAIPPAHYLENEPLRTVLQVADPNGGSPGKKDQDSVTTFWSLPLNDLAKAYDGAFAGRLAAVDQYVLFAHADLVRQQKMPDGSWGPEQIVDRVGGTPPSPYPDAKSPQFSAEADGYLAWLQTPKSQQTIVSADFPPVYYTADARPDLQWKPLDTWVTYQAQLASGISPPGAVAGQGAPAAPAAPVAPDNNPFGPAPAPAPAPPPGPPPGPAQNTGGGEDSGNGRGAGHHERGGMHSGSFMVTRNANGTMTMTNPNSGQTFASGQYQRQTPAPPGAPRPAVAAPPAAPAAAAADEASVAAVPVAPVKLPPLQAVPDSAFSAADLAKQGDMELYFHDLTVEAGNTYRYKVRYSLKNPVFEKPNFALPNSKLAETFAIDSPDSDWSDAVAVPARTRFWCSNRQPSNNSRGTGQVDFTVFVWHDGQWNKKDYGAVSTGDEVGDGEFVTHMTLLDVTNRPGPGEQPRLVLLCPDTGGPAEARNERDDATSPELQKFLKDFAAQTAPAAGAAAPAPPAAGGNPAPPVNNQPLLPGQLAPGT